MLLIRFFDLTKAALIRRATENKKRTALLPPSQRFAHPVEPNAQIRYFTKPAPA
jgi:hypothetical protein